MYLKNPSEYRDKLLELIWEFSKSPRLIIGRQNPWYFDITQQIEDKKTQLICKIKTSSTEIDQAIGVQVYDMENIKTLLDKLQYT
jgi:hypothetical protein